MEHTTANSLLRSAFQIAERRGADTNWEAFRANLLAELSHQAGEGCRILTEQEILRVTCTPLTYRVYPSNEEANDDQT